MPSIDTLKVVLYVGVLSAFVFFVTGVVQEDNPSIFAGAAIITAALLLFGGMIAIRMQQMTEDALYSEDDDE